MINSDNREDYDFRFDQNTVFSSCDYESRYLSNKDAENMARELVRYFMHEYKQIKDSLPDDELTRQEACIDFRKTHKLPKESTRNINTDLFLRFRKIIRQKNGRYVLRKLHKIYCDEAYSEAHAALLHQEPSGILAGRYPTIMEMEYMPKKYMNNKQAELYSADSDEIDKINPMGSLKGYIKPIQTQLFD